MDIQEATEISLDDFKAEFRRQCDVLLNTFPNCDTPNCRGDCITADCVARKKYFKQKRIELSERLSQENDKSKFLTEMEAVVMGFENIKIRSFGFKFLGEVLSELDDYKTAFPYFEKAIDGSIDKSYILYCLGVCLGLQNKHLDAIEYYQKAIAENNELDLAYFNLGFSYKIIGDLKNSTKYYLQLNQVKEKASERAKSQNGFWINWGENLLYNLKDFDGAIRVLEQAMAEKKKGITVDENLKWIHFNLAVAYFTKANSLFEIDPLFYSTLTKAREHKQRAIELFQDTRNENYISDLHYLDKEYQKAKELSEVSLKSSPDNIDNNNAHGQILLKLDFVDESIYYFKRALILSEGERDIRVNLAEALRKKRLFHESRFELLTVLEQDQRNTEALKCLINLNIDQCEEIAEVDEDLIQFLEESLDFAKRLANLGAGEVGLTRPEKSYNHYLSGYLCSRLYQAYNGKEYQFIKLALNHFNCVERGSPYFFKSKIAIAKLSKTARSHKDSQSKRRLITTTGITIIFFGLFLFLIGKPKVISFYKFDSSKVKLYIKTNGIVVTDTTNFFESIENSSFHSVENAASYLGQRLKKRIAGDSVGEIISVQYFTEVNQIFISSVFLVGLILLVFGLIFDEVKSLKLPGGIELEKNELRYEMNPTAFKMVR